MSFTPQQRASYGCAIIVGIFVIAFLMGLATGVVLG